MNTLVPGLLRYTLDLFEPQGLNRGFEPAVKILPKFVPNRAADHMGQAQAATDLVATGLPAEEHPGSQALPPVRFFHPAANRQARLGHALVGYEFKRGKRRTIGFRIGPEGLAVRAPRWTPLVEVDAALQEKAAWIMRKLDQTRARQAQQENARIDWKDGVCLPFFGETVQLVLDPAHKFADAGAQLVRPGAPAELAAAVVPALAQLRVALPHSATAAQMRDVVQAWLMRQARAHFVQRLDHFAPQLQVQWRRLSLSNAATRWGSARVDGSIRLNWRLVHCKPAVIDYVVVHELSHLRVMDHSPRFWDTVRAVVPDFAQRRDALKNHAGPRWD